MIPVFVPTLPMPGGTVWTPLNIPGLAAFWRADQGVTQSSGNVSAWADQSGNGNNLVGGASTQAPTWSSTSFNSSHPGVSFLETSNQYADCASPSVSSVTTFSCFALVNQSSTQAVANDYIVSLDNNNLIALYSSGGTTTIATYSGGFIGTNFTITNGIPQLLGVTLDGTNIRQYLNGTLQGTSGFSSPATVSAHWTLGNAFAQTTPWSGTIAAVVIATQTMGTTDIANLKTWCNSTFGTSL